MKRIIMVIIFLAALGGGYWGVTRSSALVAIESGYKWVARSSAVAPMPTSLTGSGTIEAETIAITAELGGRILDLKVDEGDEARPNWNKSR
jgi:multidrug efflux pump subunit AcrA (membrane-fusion protein)